MHCRPNMMPPIVYPTKGCTQHQMQMTIVPHIHPSHTTYVNHHLFQHQHYFPHTQSVVNDVSHQHVVCPGSGPFPRPF